MFQTAKNYAKRACGIVVAAALVATTFSACGNRNDEAIAQVNGFLGAAEASDFTTAANYANADVMSQLEWSEDDFNEVVDDFYDSIAGYGITADDLKANTTISSSVDSFVDKVKEVLVTGYTINEDSVDENNDVYQLTATVSTISEDDIYDIVGSELTSAATDYVTQWTEEHMDDILTMDENELYMSLYESLVPYVMDLISEKIDEIDATEETWGFTLEDVDGTLIINGVYDAE